MAHSLTSGMQAATLAAVCAPIFFIEVDTVAGNVYTWSGYGNIIWNGQTWLGGGKFIGVSPISEVTRVQAAGTAFTLSGVDIALVSLALQSMQRYMPAKMWVGAMDDNFQIIADPYLLLNGRVDSSKIITTGKTATILVTAESRLITLRLPKWRRYTDLDQRIEHPTDAGFSFVDTIQDATINFHG